MILVLSNINNRCTVNTLLYTPHTINIHIYHNNNMYYKKCVDFRFLFLVYDINMLFTSKARASK